jgi:hypothetical protein
MKRIHEAFRRDCPRIPGAVDERWEDPVGRSRLGGHGEVAEYLSTTQAYSDSEYESLMREQGFERLQRYPSLEGPTSSPDEGLLVLVGRAREAAQQGDEADRS